MHARLLAHTRPALASRLPPAADMDASTDQDAAGGASDMAPSPEVDMNLDGRMLVTSDGGNDKGCQVRAVACTTCSKARPG